MGDAHPLPDDDENVLDVVERCLGTAIDDPSLDERAVSLDQYAELIAAVERHHRGRKLPEQAEGELRPAIFAGCNVGFRYPSELAFMLISKEVVRAAVYDVKRILLYSHRVVMPNPLLGSLPSISTEPQERRLEDARLIWRSALQFYREYGTLIRRRHLLLVDAGVLLTGAFDQQIDLEAPLRQIFAEQSAFRDFDRFGSFATHAITQLAHRGKFEHRLDPFFASTEICEAYRLVLRRTAIPTPSGNRGGHFVNALLASATSVDASKLSQEDVVQMRETEELFETWRAIVENVLTAVYRQQRDELAPPADAVELQRLIDDQRRQWQSELTRLVGKSRLLQGTLDKTAVSLGIASGALVAAHGGASGIDVLGAAGAGGALAPLLNVLFGALGRLRAGPARGSLDHHFLALGRPP